MQGNEEVKIVWDECGNVHIARGSICSEDDSFLYLILRNGSQLRLSKRYLIKIEKPAGGKV